MLFVDVVLFLFVFFGGGGGNSVEQHLHKSQVGLNSGSVATLVPYSEPGYSGHPSGQTD